MFWCPYCRTEIIECVDLLPTKADLKIKRGTDTVFEVILSDSDFKPVDISLDSIRLTVRDRLGGSVKIQKTNLAGSHVDGTNGRTSFRIEDTDITDSQDDDRFDWVFEVRRIMLVGDEFVHIEGRFLVDPQVGD